MDFGIREATGDDLTFVRSNYLDAFRETQFGHSITRVLYAVRFRPLLEEVLGRSRALVTFDPEMPSVVLAALIYEPLALHPPGVIFPTVVHWLYVKGDFRRQGHARALWEAVPGIGLGAYFSAVSADARTIINGHVFPARPIYDPCWLFQKQPVIRINEALNGKTRERQDRPATIGVARP